VPSPSRGQYQRGRDRPELVRVHRWSRLLCSVTPGRTGHRAALTADAEPHRVLPSSADDRTCLKHPILSMSANLLWATTPAHLWCRSARCPSASADVPKATDLRVADVSGRADEWTSRQAALCRKWALGGCRDRLGCELGWPTAPVSPNAGERETRRDTGPYGGPTGGSIMAADAGSEIRVGFCAEDRCRSGPANRESSVPGHTAGVRSPPVASRQ
jgi:hypothetical protein